MCYELSCDVYTSACIVQVMEGFLKPLRAKDWDRALLASYRSSSVQQPPLDLEAVTAPVLIIQVCVIACTQALRMRMCASMGSLCIV